jgi:single-stranded DNA-binding protein
MSIECAFHGFLAADAELRTSKAGKPWARLRVGVGKDDAVQWASVAVFGPAASAAGTLKKADRVYVEGSIKLDTWKGSDGVERHGLSVAAFKCERTHQIGRNRPARKNGSGSGAAAGKPGVSNDFHDDEIPF